MIGIPMNISTTIPDSNNSITNHLTSWTPCEICLFLDILLTSSWNPPPPHAFSILFSYLSQLQNKVTAVGWMGVTNALANFWGFSISIEYKFSRWSTLCHYELWSTFALRFSSNQKDNLSHCLLYEVFSWQICRKSFSTSPPLTPPKNEEKKMNMNATSWL